MTGGHGGGKRHTVRSAGGGGGSARAGAELEFTRDALDKPRREGISEVQTTTDTDRQTGCGMRPSLAFIFWGSGETRAVSGCAHLSRRDSCRARVVVGAGRAAGRGARARSFVGCGCEASHPFPAASKNGLPTGVNSFLHEGRLGELWKKQVSSNPSSDSGIVAPRTTTRAPRRRDGAVMGVCESCSVLTTWDARSGSTSRYYSLR